MGPHKIKKLLYGKGHHDSDKVTSYTFDRWLISKMCKELKEIKKKKTTKTSGKQMTQFKMEHKSKQKIRKGGN